MYTKLLNEFVIKHGLILGPVSIPDKMYFCKISRSLEATRFVFIMPQCSEIWQAPPAAETPVKFQSDAII